MVPATNRVTPTKQLDDRFIDLHNEIKPVLQRIQTLNNCDNVDLAYHNKTLIGSIIHLFVAQM